MPKEQEAPPIHPIRGWRRRRGYDYATVAGLVADHGRMICPRYIEAIELGYRRPEYSLSLIFQAVAENEVTAHEIMTFPVKARSYKRAA